MLKEIGVDSVVPLHCTGEPFCEFAKTKMPNRMLRAHTGTRIPRLSESTAHANGEKFARRIGPPEMRTRRGREMTV